jgi:hypothetical protein
LDYSGTPEKILVTNVIGTVPNICTYQAVNRSYSPLKPIFFAAALMAAGPASAERLIDPLRFFEGRTESLSTVKVVLKKPFLSKSIGSGEIRSDGSLYLVQRVEDDGKPPHDRRWHIRQTGPKTFTGTMTEARGPVVVEEIDGRYRFRFKMKGNLSVEQWVIPTDGGKSAKSKVTIRKLGVTVASSEGTIRRLANN